MLPYAEVIVQIANRKLDRVFHYSIPEELAGQIRLGSNVLVPFGNKAVEGYVIGFSDVAEVESTKAITSIKNTSTLCTEELLGLVKWMAEYYMCPLSTALKAVLPSLENVKETWREQYVVLSSEYTMAEILEQVSRAPKQVEIVAMLDGAEPVSLACFKEKGYSTAALKALRQKGLVKLHCGREKKDYVLQQPLELTAEQKKVFAPIKAALLQKEFCVQLLYGVTGSGKTEIYLQALALNKLLDKQAIVLLPEITLTEQMMNRYQARFGEEVAIWHSNLSSREKRRTWQRITAGQASIIVGARSAIFAPFTKIGLIIIDEEHETSYQQESAPKYHAREVALHRAASHQALVILGSATPSIESAYQASTGTYQLLALEQRVDAKPLPDFKIIDLRAELRQGNFSIFSRELQAKLEQCLLKKEQAILFLNRRGYNSFFICRDCGHTIKCCRCSISLTYHAASNNLKCHYCGYQQEVPLLCPRCGSKRIRGFGVGTEKVEQEINKLYPAARVARMDTDISDRKGYRQGILNSFHKGEIDILVGTQMIAKGLDFPGVTLVGVISADLTLNLPDFRARERTFQLLTQVGGRAGRGNKKGEVIVQTYWPEHEALIAARQNNYYEFYQKEIMLRNELGYPPFSHLLRVVIFGEDEDKVAQGSFDFAALVRQELQNYPFLHVLGPAPASIHKLQNYYRWQLIFKGPRMEEMRHMVTYCLKKYHEEAYLAGHLRWSTDVDPVGML